MRPFRRIQHDQNGNRRFVHWRKTDERRDILIRRITSGVGVDFLSRSRFASRGVTIQPRGCAGAFQNYVFHHFSDGGCGLGIGNFGGFGTLRQRQVGAAAATNFLDHMRAIQRPPVGDGRDRGNNLHGGHADFLPDGHRPDRTGRPIIQGSQFAVIFSRQFDSGGLADSELAHRLVKARRAQIQCDLDGPHVAGMGQHVAHAEHAKRMPVVNQAPSYENRAHLAIHHHVGIGHMILDCGGHGDGFESGARLIGGGDCKILPFFHGKFTGIVGIEGGPIGHGQQRAVRRILNHDRAAFRVRLGHGDGQFFLGDVLNAFVDGQHDAGAGIGGGFVAIVKLALAIGHNHDAAGPAANQLIEFLLDAAHAFFVDIDPAEDVREEFVLGVDPAVFFLEEDAFQVHLVDTFDHIGGKFFGETDGFRRVANFRFEVFRRNVEHAGKQARDHIGLFDFGRIGEDRVHRNADGQLASFAVEDVSAHRTDFVCALLLMLGFGEVIAIAEELEVTQAGQHRPHPNRRHAPDDQPAETRVALLHGSALTH